MSQEIKFIFKCHGNTKKVRVKNSDSDSTKSGNSHSSHLSAGEESPPYSRRKSGLDSRNGFIYKNNLAVMQESPYEIKSVKSEHSHRSQLVPDKMSSRPQSPGSVSHKSVVSNSDVETEANGRNPFEAITDE